MKTVILRMGKCFGVFLLVMLMNIFFLLLFSWRHHEATKKSEGLNISETKTSKVMQVGMRSKVHHLVFFLDQVITSQVV